MLKNSLSLKHLSKIVIAAFSLCFFIAFTSTTIHAQKTPTKRQQYVSSLDSLLTPQPIIVNLKKDLIYDQHTLNDTYKYGKKDREFQWEKIKTKLAFLDSMQKRKSKWVILQNYKNKNGLSPLVKNYKKDAYGQTSDTFGIERTQSIALFSINDTISPERYEHDGSLVKLVDQNDSLSSFINIQTLNFDGKWNILKKYAKVLNDTIIFNKVICVDVSNQNITTLEKVGNEWLIRSMNPATTGVHRPPHMQETPEGIFIIQEKKSKMFYLVDGTQDIAGFAPYANRFSDGGYIHGVPLVNPNTTLIEYSWTLGTIPRSHMCVRNATSHAKFIYDWAPTNATVLFVFK